MKPKNRMEIETLNEAILDIPVLSAEELERIMAGSNPDADCIVFTGPCFDYCGPCTVYGREPL